MPLFPENTGIQKQQQQQQQPHLAPKSSHPPASIQIKNRRKRYLDSHPEYFSPALELAGTSVQFPCPFFSIISHPLNPSPADPLLYDRLIRRFQTAGEREAEGRIKGHSGMLEADLERAEAKMEALAHPDPNAAYTYSRGPHGEILAEEHDEIPVSKEEGIERWRQEMELRFVKGADDEFEYALVDECEDYDDWSEEQEKYFDQEEPKWLVDQGSESSSSPSRQPELKGETGIQDF
ncbi:hypothetical protein FQN57_003911 [Myotisia sp. PD_48]|nr:hypothetical protein FQN57_003911 [Myotisia sp. PD_48]